MYERQIRLGMLSPHAEPFILETEKLARETEQQFTTDNNNDVSHEKENTIYHISETHHVETDIKTKKKYKIRKISQRKK